MVRNQTGSNDATQRPTDGRYLPLSGKRVIELGQLIPAPLTSRRLADLGAEVVRVEAPNPRLRLSGSMDTWLNRNKKSVVLDLKSTEGRDSFLELARAADVIVAGFRPEMFDEVGISWAELRRQEHRLVVCSVTGFGLTGPLASMPAHGMNLEALSGCLNFGYRNGRLVMPVMPWAMEVAALNAALAIVAALHRVETTGEGVWIDAAVWDAGVEANRLILQSILDGEAVPQVGTSARSSAYIASDGKKVVFMAWEKKFWENFCRGVGRLDLLTGEGPSDNEGGLYDELQAIFSSATGAEWQERFLAWDVAACVALEPDDLLGHPHMQARGLVQPAKDGRPATIADAIRYVEYDTRLGLDPTPAPTLGQDTEDVLRRWRKNDTSVRPPTVER